MIPDEIINQIIEYGEIIDKKNYSPGSSGNISLRYKEGLLITASGSSNGKLREEDLIYIDFTGQIISGKKSPSSEKLLHIAYYQKRQDINAIIHVHPPYLSTFAAARKSLEKPILAEIVHYFGSIPLADYATPSSQKLVENTAKYFDNYNAIIMANHGFIVGDTNIQEAYLKLELAESYAQIVLNTKLLGGGVALSKAAVREIEELKNQNGCK